MLYEYRPLYWQHDAAARRSACPTVDTVVVRGPVRRLYNSHECTLQRRMYGLYTALPYDRYRQVPEK